MGLIVDSCLNKLNICENKDDDTDENFLKQKMFNFSNKENLESEDELLDEDIRLQLIQKETKNCFVIPRDTESLKKRATIISQNKIDPWSVYKEIEEIGSGVYGTVKKVYLRKHPDTIRALKIISKDILMEEIDSEKVLDEIIKLKNLEHENLGKIYDFYNDEKNYYIITDFFEQGDLLDKITTIDWTNQDIFKSIMKQIFEALSFLHSENVLHGDIKLENIMIYNIKKTVKSIFDIDEDTRNISKEKLESLNAKYDCTIKLIDFGFSNIFKKKKEIKSNIIYSSPEIINNLPDNKCDEWSCGVLMYFLLCGKPPFQGGNEEEIFKKIKKNECDFSQPQFNQINENCIDLIKKLLEHKISKRIKSEDALMHPFFTELNEEIDDNSSIKTFE